MRTVNLLAGCGRGLALWGVLRAGALAAAATAQGPMLQTAAPSTILTDGPLLLRVRQQGLATEGERVGVDLWDYKRPDGGSIRAAPDYLLPFSERKKKWEHMDIEGVISTGLRDPLLMAAVRYRDAEYEDVALATGGDDMRELLLEREFAEARKAGR